MPVATGCVTNWHAGSMVALGWVGADAPGGAPRPEPRRGERRPGAAQRRRLI